MRVASLLTFAAPALLACAGAGTSTTRATPAPAAETARDLLPSCPDAPGGATEEWRQVSGPGFRLCVPAAWEAFTPRDTGGVAHGGWRRTDVGSIAWNAGPRAPGPGRMVPYNDRRVSTLWLGMREGELLELGLPGLTTFYVSVPATATEPALRMTLLAQSDAAKAQLLAALRTLRPVATGAPRS